MAPEILRGEKYTEASDVYSFGVILWELVTGEIPHRGRSVPQIVGSVGYHGEKLKLPQLHQQNQDQRLYSKNPMLNDTTDQGPQYQNFQQHSRSLEPSNRHLRKIINNCLLHDASQRPSFSHILYSSGFEPNKEAVA